MKKQRLQQESKIMQNSAEDEESKKIDPAHYVQIEEWVNKCIVGGDAKMGNASLL